MAHPTFVSAPLAAAGGQLSVTLAAAVLDVLPAAPAVFGMERDTFAPGARRTVDTGAHGDVAHIEAGVLTVEFDRAVSVARHASGNTDTIPAGGTAMLEAGDGIVLPGGAVGTLTNAGPLPAVILVAFVGSAAGSPSGPPAGIDGVAATLVALGVAQPVPGAPGILAMTRVGLDAGAVFASDGAAPSLRLIVAEAGPVDATFDATVVVTRTASRTPDQVPGGQPIRLDAGDAVLVPLSASGAFTNPGPTALTLLTASLQEFSAGGEESVPMGTETVR